MRYRLVVKNVLMKIKSLLNRYAEIGRPAKPRRYFYFVFIFLQLFWWTRMSAAAFDAPSAGCRVWRDPVAPDTIVARLPENCGPAKTRTGASCVIEALPADAEALETDGEIVFAAVAPFPTVSDSIYREGIRQSWLGLCSAGRCQKIFIPKRWTKALTALFGETPASENIEAIADKNLLERTWRAANTVAIVPFDELDPRWKVLGLTLDDGSVVNPFSPDFEPESYPLTLRFRARELKPDGCGAGLKLASNRDPKRLTTVTLTGTTAISRRLAYQVENDGVEAIVAGIAETLKKSDFVHVSNEASFFADCPSGVPLRQDPKFCSRPAYFKALTAVGTNIVELTGNHNLDWGPQPFLDSLGLFRRAGMKTYGGGSTLQEALKPLHIRHHGNHLVFLGCNPVGPAGAWATETSPGAAPCDYPKLIRTVKNLAALGYLPIVTFQQVEYDYHSVPTIQAASFYNLAEAGAVIVSGSQAHIPQGFAFIGRRFMHFGLGNFLFDQTSKIERDSFVDRHYFYNGKYLGVAIETIRRGDDMKISFLSGSERAELLKTVFNYSVFKRVFQDEK